MNKLLNSLRIPLMLFSCSLLFVAQRYISGEESKSVLTIVSIVCMLAALMVNIILMLTSKSESAGQGKSFGFLVWWKVLVIAGCGLSLVYINSLGTAAEPETMSQKIMLASWLTLFILGVFLAIGSELSMREFGLGTLAEPKRVVRSGVSWLFAGMFLVGCIAINYSGARYDKSSDWSYLKVTSPSEATKNLLAAHPDESIEVKLFFTRDSDVLTFVREYFSSVSNSFKNITVEQLDKDLVPVLAEKHKVRANGYVLLLKNSGEGGEADSQKINIGESIKTARKNIAKMDELFRASFVKLVAKEKVAYFTVGHGENYWFGEKDPMKSINGVYEQLRRLNYKVKRFGIRDGSMEKVPDDASFVAIIGPTSKFAEEEVNVIKSYVEGGGKLFVALDVNDDELGAISAGDRPLYNLLKDWGLMYQTHVIADEEKFAKATGGLSDRWFVFTNSFTSHESVKNLARFDTRLAMLFFKSGYFELNKKVDKWALSETIRTFSSSFVDLNQNYKFDKGEETKNSRVLAVALETKSQKEDEKAKAGKVFALADASALADLMMLNSRGNQLFAFESMNWLVDAADLSGAGESEEDVKIIFKRDEDLAIYYGTIAGPPILVLLIGLFVVGRRRKKTTRG